MISPQYLVKKGTKMSKKVPKKAQKTLKKAQKVSKSGAKWGKMGLFFILLQSNMKKQLKIRVSTT